MNSPDLVRLSACPRSRKSCFREWNFRNSSLEVVSLPRRSGPRRLRSRQPMSFVDGDDDSRWQLRVVSGDTVEEFAFELRDTGGDLTSFGRRARAVDRRLAQRRIAVLAARDLEPRPIGQGALPAVNALTPAFRPKTKHSYMML